MDIPSMGIPSTEYLGHGDPGGEMWWAEMSSAGILSMEMPPMKGDDMVIPEDVEVKSTGLQTTGIPSLGMPPVGIHPTDTNSRGDPVH